MKKFNRRTVIATLGLLPFAAVAQDQETGEPTKKKKRTQRRGKKGPKRKEVQPPTEAGEIKIQAKKKVAFRKGRP